MKYFKEFLLLNMSVNTASLLSPEANEFLSSMYLTWASLSLSSNFTLKYLLGGFLIKDNSEKVFLLNSPL